VHVCRNFFGSQVHSCQVDISIDALHDIPAFSNSACPAVFIRAPAILSVGPEVYRCFIFLHLIFYWTGLAITQLHLLSITSLL
jgi:glutamine amidotransferase PdxT